MKGASRRPAIKAVVTPTIAAMFPTLLLLVARGGDIRTAHAFHSSARISRHSGPESKACQHRQLNGEGSGFCDFQNHDLSLQLSATPNSGGDDPPQQPPPIIDIELPMEDGDDDKDNVPEPSTQEENPTAGSVEAVSLDDLDAAIAAAARSPPGIKVNDPLSMGTESRSLINGDVQPSLGSQTSPLRPATKTRLVPYQQQQSIASKMPPSQSSPSNSRGMFQASRSDDISFETVTPIPPPPKRAVKEGSSPLPPPSAPSTFQSSALGDDMSFEAKPTLFAPKTKKQRVVQMPLATEPAPSTFRQSDLSDMSFEAKLDVKLDKLTSERVSFEAKLEELTSKRIVQMEEQQQQQQPPPKPKPAQGSSMFRTRTVPSSAEDGSSGITLDYQAPKERRVVKPIEPEEPVSSSTLDDNEIPGPSEQTRAVEMEQKKEYAPSTFESKTSGMSFEAKSDTTSPKQKRIVEMEQKKEYAPLTFESKTSDMSFEAKANNTSPKQKRIVEMEQKKEYAPSTFESKTSDMSFEAKANNTSPKQKRIVEMEQKKEYAPSTFESKTGDMSFEAKANNTSPKQKRIVEMEQKKEYTPSTFESKTGDMSFEAKADISPPKQKRIIEMEQKKEYTPSTFESKTGDMSFEAKVDISPPKKSRIVPAADENKSAPSPPKSNNTESTSKIQPIVSPPMKQTNESIKTEDTAPSSEYEIVGSNMFEAMTSQTRPEPTPRLQRIVQMTEKKEPASSTFRPSELSDMSFEAKPVPSNATKTQRIVKMAEKKDPAPSTFANDSDGMMYEAAAGLMFDAAVTKQKPSVSPPQKNQENKQRPPEVAPKAVTSAPQEETRNLQPRVVSRATKPVPEATIPSTQEEIKKKQEGPPKVTTPPPQPEYEAASGSMFEASLAEDEASKSPPSQQMKKIQSEGEKQAQPRVIPKASTSTPLPQQEQEEEAKTKGAAPPYTKTTAVRSAVSTDTSFETSPRATIAPLKTRLVPPSATTMFRRSAPKRDVPPPSRTMFKSMTPTKETPPPSRTMFQSRVPETEKPLPSSRTMFRQKEPKEEKPPRATYTMFRSDEKPEAEKPPPSRTMFRSDEPSETKKPPPSRTMFRSEISEKEISPPSTAMFPRKEFETSTQAQPTPETVADAVSTDFSISTPTSATPEKEGAKKKQVLQGESGAKPKETNSRTKISGVSFETKPISSEKDQDIDIPDKKEVQPSQELETERSDVVSEAKKSPPTKQVQRSDIKEQKETPSATIPESKISDVSSEEKKSPSIEQTKRTIKMSEKSEDSSTKMFESDDSGMMFEARRRPASNAEEVGTMFNARTTQPPKNKVEPLKKLVQGTGALIGSMFRARTSAAPSDKDKEQLRLAEVAQQKEKARVAKQMRLAEERRLQEEARQKDKVKIAEEMRLEEKEMREEEARLQYEGELAKKAQLTEEKRLAEAEKERVAEENRLAEKLAEEARVAQQEAETMRLAKEAQLAEIEKEKQKAPDLVRKPVDEVPPVAKGTSSRDNIPKANVKSIKREDSGIGIEISVSNQSPRRFATPRKAFQGTSDAISFKVESSKSREPIPKVIKPTEKKAESPPETSRAGNDSMSFNVEPSKTRLIEAAEKKEAPASTSDASTSPEADTSISNSSTKREPTPKVIKPTEKKVASRPKASQAANDGMSFEVEPSKTRLVKAAEETPASASDASTSPKAKVTDASSSGLFQQGSKKVTFQSDGSQFVYQSPKEKRLFLAQKVAAQMFKAQESPPTTFETDDDGMNMVLRGRRTAKSVAQKPVPKESDSIDRVNPDPDNASKNLPRVLPRKSDNDSMKMASFIANNLSKQSASALGSVQQSKMDVGSVKTTAKDIQKFAKFVSDGLQMVNEDSLKEKKSVTLAEARRQKKARERKNIFGFEIGPSEEEMAAQLMEGGKHLAVEGGKKFAKFASDGLQMVYRAAEKQTKEYIASSTATSTAKKDSSHVRERKPVEAISTPFFAASDDISVTKKEDKPNPSTASDGVPLNHFTATNKGTKMEGTKADDKQKKDTSVKESPKPFFAATARKKTENAESNTSASAAHGKTVDEPTLSASTSSLLRSGGRVFVKFVGDGLQMVQKVATAKEKRNRRPPT